MTFGSDRSPGMILLKLDRRRDGQEGRHIARAPPFVLIDKSGSARRDGFISPRNDKRFDKSLHFGPRIQKARALWRAQPFIVRCVNNTVTTLLGPDLALVTPLSKRDYMAT